MRVTLEPLDKWTIGSMWRMAGAVALLGSLSVAKLFFVDDSPLWMRVSSPLLAAYFAYSLYWYAKTPEKEYLKAVKGEMSFQELKERVETEEFEELLGAKAASGGKGSEFCMLVSNNWLLVHVPGVRKPVCIPEVKVREVHIMGFANRRRHQTRAVFP